MKPGVGFRQGAAGRQYPLIVARLEGSRARDNDGRAEGDLVGCSLDHFHVVCIAEDDARRRVREQSLHLSRSIHRIYWHGYRAQFPGRQDGDQKLRIVLEDDRDPVAGADLLVEHPGSERLAGAIQLAVRKQSVEIDRGGHFAVRSDRVAEQVKNTVAAWAKSLWLASIERMPWPPQKERAAHLTQHWPVPVGRSAVRFHSWSVSLSKASKFGS